MNIWNKAIKTIVFTSVCLVTAIRCSDVSFDSRPSPTCEAINEIGDECKKTTSGVEITVSQKAGRVDILFVTDNSGSMYAEQEQMGNRFENLYNNIAGLDWRIAITTTDISASPGNSTKRTANGQGAYQDGKFLYFPNNTQVLTSSMSLADAKSNFLARIARPESQECDNNNFETNDVACGSGDERGIYAVNMAIDRGHSNFFRSGAHLAVVILSDEDERSKGGTILGYPLEDYDLPTTLVTKVKNQLGSDKSLSVHSVVVDPSIDPNCEATQDAQGNNIDGHPGNQYLALSRPSTSLQSLGGLVPGSVGSICSNDYGNVLQNIASKIQDVVNTIQLVCKPVKDPVVTYSPSSSTSISYTIDSQNRLNFSPAPAPNTTVTVTYTCPAGT